MGTKVNFGPLLLLSWDDLIKSMVDNNVLGERCRCKNANDSRVDAVRSILFSIMSPRV